MSIINQLEEMQKSALSKLADVQDIVVLKMKIECDDAEQISKLIQKQTQQMDFLSTHGSNNQIFVFLQKLKIVLADENQFIKDFTAKLQEPRLPYKETPLFASDQDFGSIELISQPCSVEYKETKHHEARLLFDIKSTPKLFSLHNQIIDFPIVKCSGISGIVFIDQNKIDVCSYESSKLYVYDIDVKRLKEVQLKLLVIHGDLHITALTRP
ncbi:unnamed protein product [Mytilus edulis]|uniref:Uncharacterized protein n=1 Tax=Mytilus edulis TaxID=6550 RepID=A0A8S3Q208_MYTED|nr:unnamed protein product [Mytilus edulis]